MDIFAHGLVTYAVRQSANIRSNWRWLVFFGMFPDLVWLPFTALQFLTHGNIYYFQGPYNLSHSFVIWVAVSLLATIRWRKIFFYTWPWALHILIDIPGHLDMRTPILWPISNFKFHGLFSWLTLPWLLATYGALAISFFWLWRAGRLKPKSTR